MPKGYYYLVNTLKLINFSFIVPIVGVLVLSACCDNNAIGSNISKLQSSVAREKNQAAQELARCGKAAEAAVPLLSELIYDSNVGVQSSAAYALRKIDTQAARAVLSSAEASRSSR
jgi:hypothetical protein